MKLFVRFFLVLLAPKALIFPFKGKKRFEFPLS